MGFSTPLQRGGGEKEENMGNGRDKVEEIQ
jgi:hypothetical protein